MAEGLVERRSPLNEVYQIGVFGDDTKSPGVTFSERRGLSIIQVAAWAEQADASITAIGKAVGVSPSATSLSAVNANATAAIWVGPNRWLVVEKESRDLAAIVGASVSNELAAVTDQSHSRCVLRLTGEQSRNVLRKGTTLDLDPAYFKAGEAKTTSLFHINALIHCLEESMFDIYVARSFGQSFFGVITHSAAEYGYQVADPL